MGKRSWLLVVQTAIGLALLLAWLSLVDLNETVRTLGNAQWGYVAAAGVVGWSTTYIRAMRWRIILRPLTESRQPDIWLIVLASSLINFVIPIRSGEFARSLFLKQRNGTPVSASLPTVAVDRSFDLLVVLLIGATGLLGSTVVGSSLPLALSLGATLLIAFLVLVASAILWEARIVALIDRLFPRSFGRAIQERLTGLLISLVRGFSAVGRQPRSLVPLIAASLAASIIDASVFFLLFVGVGHPISPFMALIGYSFFALTFIVPGAPGYVGSFEAFGSLVFGGALGVPQATAASVVLIYHALNALMLGIAGGSAFLLLGMRPGAIFRSVVKSTPPSDTETIDLG